MKNLEVERGTSRVHRLVPPAALHGISKRFGHVVANERVNFELRVGEVHALLGENGAGKTTLMNILSGVLRPEEGDIVLDGAPVAFHSPKEALNLGIAMVHQHFRLFEGLTVAENLHIGWGETPRVYAGLRPLRRRTLEAVERFGLDIDPRASVWQLSVGEKQRLEILRALSRGADILILDEPTSVLTPSDTEALFRLVTRLRTEDKTVVFISHKLPEVLAIADRVTVMRQGRNVGTLEREQMDSRVLAQLMVGGEVPRTIREPAEVKEAVLVAEHLHALDDRGLVALNDVSLNVRAGEIVGVAGVAGNGQRELSEVLAGLRRPAQGRIVVAGRDLSGGRPRDFVRAGVGFVPEDRLGTGLAPTEPIWRNAVLKRYWRRSLAYGPLLRERAAREHTERLVASVRLSAASIDASVRTLSGGHAQRLLTGRELEVGNAVLILTYPTRGLDIAAVAGVRAAILDARKHGVATLLISEDLDELFELADRIVVMYAGSVGGEFEANRVDRETIGALMSGLSSHEIAGERGSA